MSGTVVTPLATRRVGNKTTPRRRVQQPLGRTTPRQPLRPVDKLHSKQASGGYKENEQPVLHANIPKHANEGNDTALKTLKGTPQVGSKSRAALSEAKPASALATMPQPRAVPSAARKRAHSPPSSEQQPQTSPPASAAAPSASPSGAATSSSPSAAAAGTVPSKGQAKKSSRHSIGDVQIGTDCAPCVTLKERLINTEEDRREYENRYLSLQEEGSRLYEAYETKCARLREVTARHKDQESIIRSLTKENEELSTHYNQIYNSYQQELQRAERPCVQCATAAATSPSASPGSSLNCSAESGLGDLSEDTRGFFKALADAADRPLAAPSSLSSSSSSSSSAAFPSSSSSSLCPACADTTALQARLVEVEQLHSDALKKAEGSRALLSHTVQSNEAFKSEVEALQRQLANMQAKMAEEVSAAKEEMMRKWTEEEAALQTALKDRDARLAMLSAQMEQARRDNEELVEFGEAERQSMVEAGEELEKKYLAISQQLTTLTKQLQEEESLRQRMEKAFEEQEAEWANAKKKVEHARDEVAEQLNKIQAEQEDVKTQLKERNQQLQELDEALTRSKGENLELQEDSATLKEELEGKETAVQTLKTKLLNTEEKLKASTQQTLRLEETLQKLRKNLDKSSKDLQAAGAQTVAQSHTESKLRKELSAAEAQATRRARDLAKLKTELAAALATQAKSKAHLENAQEQKQLVDRELAKLHSQRASNDSVELELRDKLERSHKAMSVAEQELTELRRESIALRSQVSQSEGRFRAMEEQQQRLQNREKVLVEENMQLVTRNQEVKVAADKVMAQLTRMAEEVRQVEQLKFQAETHRMVEAAWREEKSALQQQLQLLLEKAQRDGRQQLAGVVKHQAEKAAELALLREKVAEHAAVQRQNQELLLELKRKGDERTGLLEDELAFQKQETQESQNMMRQISLRLCRHKDKFKDDPELLSFLRNLSS
eukprot:g872.t1